MPAGRTKGAELVSHSFCLCFWVQSYLWKIVIIFVVGCFVSIYIWWANRRDFK